MPIVGLNQVVVGSPQKRRLDRATVEFGEGVTVLLGPNGAGKSTLLRTLLGTIAPDSGEVTVDGAAVRGRALPRLGLGWVPQRAQLPDGLRVAGAVGYAAWLQKVPRRESAEAVDRALALTNLESMAGKRIGTLSGGQQQRVALACALVHRPPILLVDEPTVGLDPAERHAFHVALRDGTREGACVVMATHLLEDVMPVAARVVVLVAGAVRFSGTAKAFAESAGEVATGTSALEQAYLRLVEPAGAAA